VIALIALGVPAAQTRRNRSVENPIEHVLPLFRLVGRLASMLAIAQNMVPVTSAQVRMARAALNWTVRDLAAATGLHRNTITNIEVGRYAGDPATLTLLKDVLTRAGVEFIDENGGGPGVRLRKSGKEKLRK
jgi:DNA-binding XRE family transcriptional regulator